MLNLRTLEKVLLAAVLFQSAQMSVAVSAVPNILLIVSEDQGAYMGALGTPGLSTPNMDSIANAGVLFRNGHVPLPTCSVARTSLLTGTMPHTHGTLRNVNEHFGPDPSGNPWFSNPNSFYNQNRLNPRVPTLIELLDQRGYRTAITSKFHMSPHDRFPFDVWIKGEIDGVDVATGQNTTLEQFMVESNQAGSPFFAMVNVRSPHRPFSPFQTSSQPDPDPSIIEMPASLPQTQVVRDDWTQFLKAIQRTDDQIGVVLRALDGSGLQDDTVVIFISDHGPAYHNAKWTPYDLGLHVPLVIQGPGINGGLVSAQMASIIDLFPTLLDLAGIPIPAGAQGYSLRQILVGTATQTEREYILGEFVHPSGHVEHTIHDPRFHLIHRQNVELARFVPADNRDMSPWENPVYQETITRQGAFPASFEQLRRIDNGALGGTPLVKELYDLEEDPWETKNLVNNPNFAPHTNRLLVALQVEAVRTGDTDVLVFGTVPFSSNAPANSLDRLDRGPGDLNKDANWSTEFYGNNGDDFLLTGRLVDAPRGSRALAVFDGQERGSADDFNVSVATRFAGFGVGGGVVFGYVDDENFMEFQLLDGRSVAGGRGKDVRLRSRIGGIERDLLFIENLPNYSGGWFKVSAAYTAETMTLRLTIFDANGNTYFARSIKLDKPLSAASGFGFSTWSSGASQFDDFSVRLTQGIPPGGNLPLLGDFNDDKQLNLEDVVLLRSAYGTSTPATAKLNLSLPDETVDEADLEYWLHRVLPIVIGADI